MCYMEELKNIEKLEQKEGKMENKEATPGGEQDTVKELL